MSLPSRSAERPAETLSIGGAQPPKPPLHPFALVDLQHRRVEYLRLSVTDRCNFRCTYCMPAQGVDVVPRADLLDFAELETLTRVFVSLGVRRVRITGGEPLVRRGIVDLVARLAAIPGVDDLAMTTNGHLLPELAASLRGAGLQRLNVSVDTLDPAKFAAVTRGGDLATVLAGLAAARAAGFGPIKLNAVVQAGTTTDELVALCDYARTHGDILRFIEYMPIGVDDHWGQTTWLPMAQVRASLDVAYDVVPDEAHAVVGGGPARYWLATHRATGQRVQLGFIAAVSEKFCEACNRVRLSPTGVLRECLSARGHLSLRDHLRAGADTETLKRLIVDALHGKVAGHGYDAAVGTLETMSAIGG